MIFSSSNRCILRFQPLIFRGVWKGYPWKWTPGKGDSYWTPPFLGGENLSFREGKSHDLNFRACHFLHHIVLFSMGTFGPGPLGKHTPSIHPRRGWKRVTRLATARKVLRSLLLGLESMLESHLTWWDRMTGELVRGMVELICHVYLYIHIYIYTYDMLCIHIYR